MFSQIIPHISRIWSVKNKWLLPLQHYFGTQKSITKMCPSRINSGCLVSAWKGGDNSRSSWQLVLWVGYLSKAQQTVSNLENGEEQRRSLVLWHLSWLPQDTLSKWPLTWDNKLFHIVWACSLTHPYSIHPSICPLFHLSVHPFVCLSIYLLIHLSTHLSNCLSPYPSISLSTHLLIYLSVYPSIHPLSELPTQNITLDPPTSPSLCPFLHLPFIQTYTYLHIHPCISLLNHPAISPPSFHLSVYPVVLLFIHLPVHPSVHQIFIES